MDFSNYIIEVTESFRILGGYLIGIFFSLSGILWRLVAVFIPGTAANA